MFLQLAGHLSSLWNCIYRSSRGSLWAGQGNCLGTGKSCLPRRCTPLVWLLWGSPRPLSNDNRGRLVRRAESAQEELEQGVRFSVSKGDKEHIRFISSKQRVRINFLIFTTQSNNNPLEDLHFFFYGFVPKYIVAWNRQLPYYTANKKCDLIRSYLWFKIGEDSDPILPCYSM